MKNLLITLVVAAALCVVSFALMYRLNDEPMLRRAAREGDTMLWLRAEFELNDVQFAAIEKLHDDFAEKCVGHCRAIADAKRRSATSSEVAALEKTCVDAMTTHFRAVAALMPPGRGDRYLEIVMPRIAGYDHRGPPNLQVKP